MPICPCSHSADRLLGDKAPAGKEGSPRSRELLVVHSETPPSPSQPRADGVTDADGITDAIVIAEESSWCMKRDPQNVTQALNAQGELGDMSQPGLSAAIFKEHIVKSNGEMLRASHGHKEENGDAGTESIPTLRAWCCGLRGCNTQACSYISRAHKATLHKATPRAFQRDTSCIGGSDLLAHLKDQGTGRGGTGLQHSPGTLHPEHWGMKTKTKVEKPSIPRGKIKFVTWVTNWPA